MACYDRGADFPFQGMGGKSLGPLIMVRVDQKLNSTDGFDVLACYLTLRGSPEYIRSDNSPELIFQKTGLKPLISVGKDPTVRRRRSKLLNPSTLVGGG